MDGKRKSLAKSPKPGTPMTGNRKSIVKTPKGATPKNIVQDQKFGSAKKRKSMQLEETPGKRKSLKKEVEPDSEDDDDDFDAAGSEEDSDIGSDEEEVDDEMGSDEDDDDIEEDDGNESDTEDEDDAEPEEKKSKQTKASAKKAKSSKPDKFGADEEKTIFVGNLPKDIKIDEVKKHFGKYGKVVSARFRSAPVADPRTPKKVAVIKKEFHSERTNINAYVVFETKEIAEKALRANGSEIKGHRIRVDFAKKQSYDSKKAVFVGNVPFGADEKELYGVFESCGKISHVRIIRNKSNGTGKGFAYVNFESGDSIELALLKNETNLCGRSLRVQRCQENPSRRPKAKKNAKLEKPSSGGNSKKSRKPTPRSLGKGGSPKKNENAAFQGQEAQGKVQKRKQKGKMSPKKKQAIETLTKSLPGSAKKAK